MSDILDFYSDPAKVQEVLNQSDEWWEKTHDFIQWIFPLPEPSRFNPDAPIATPEDYQKLLTHYDAQIFDLVDRFLYFLGLKRNPKGIVRQENYSWWIQNNNHNYLRVTRCIRFLTLCGFEDLALEILIYLRELFQEHPKEIGQRTMLFWYDAYVMSLPMARNS